MLKNYKNANILRSLLTIQHTSSKVNIILLPGGRNSQCACWFSQSCLNEKNDIVLLNFGKAMHPNHDDVIKYNTTFCALLDLCAGNSPVPVNCPHKGQWRGALMFYLICAWINSWVYNRGAGNLRRHRAHYDIIVMVIKKPSGVNICAHGRNYYALLK